MKNGAGARLDGGLAVSAPTVMAASIARERRRVLADLVALAKPRVVLMILVTAAVGYYVGLAGAPDYARLLHLLIGTLLLALALIWIPDATDSDTLARALGITSVLMLAGAHASLLLARLRDRDTRSGMVNQQRFVGRH